MKDAACITSESLDRARAGDAQAFAVLVRAHQRMVYSLALRMLADRHEAEDVAQEAFLQLHRRLLLIQSATHLVFWLRKVTANLAIDRLRSAPRHEVLPLDDEPGGMAADSSTDPLLQRQMRGLVAALPPGARAVVLLRYQEDLDPTEIAATLDMSINTVKSHLRRSLAELRKNFDAQQPMTGNSPDSSNTEGVATALGVSENRQS